MDITRRYFIKLAGFLGGGLLLPASLRALPSLRHRKLVIIHLAGGNDHWNTLIPFDDAAYRTLRPSLNVPFSSCIPLTDTWGLHPALGGIKQLYDNDQVHMIRGWHQPADWLHHRDHSALLLQGPGNIFSADRQSLEQQLLQIQTALSVEQQQVFIATHPGYDTHVNQTEKHHSLLQELDENITRFTKSLSVAGDLDRTLIVILSEFGRSLEENEFGGTDHDYQGLMILIGQRFEKPAIQVFSEQAQGTCLTDMLPAIRKRWLNNHSSSTKAVLSC